MKCNNTYCNWCVFDTCCHEDDKVHKNSELQKPNQLDCPSALRSDFETMVKDLYYWNLGRLATIGFISSKKIVSVLNDMKFKELLDLHSILSKISS